MEKPAGLSLRGTTISELMEFRYDTVIHEQQFFQITFKRFLLNSLPDLDLNEPESLNNTPITLHFKSASGKIKQVTANIIVLKCIDKPGHSPEVSISGTFYSPEGKFPKLNRLVLFAIVLPIFLTGLVFLYVDHLRHELVEKKGTVGSYGIASSYKGRRNYNFKIIPFKASFNRGYYQSVFDTPSEHINELFTVDNDGDRANGTGQPVRFYVFETDVDKLSDKAETITFFNLQHAKSSYSGVDQFLDVLYYVKGHLWRYLILIIYAFMEMAAIGFVFYYYKMFAFYHDGRKRILFWSFIALVAILNMPIILIFLL
ncbi:hypothetical protein [Pedobacter sp. AJM]|uniref:hypothetical protein n=1 Tax=Pedobacter sp. AJM TaxID=2003629 RepID=UPI0011250AC6|nr:hypothetical protein [Pedobacter sp. AJM]